MHPLYQEHDAKAFLRHTAEGNKESNDAYITIYLNKS